MTVNCLEWLGLPSLLLGWFYLSISWLKNGISFHRRCRELFLTSFPFDSSLGAPAKTLPYLIEGLSTIFLILLLVTTTMGLWDLPFYIDWYDLGGWQTLRGMRTITLQKSSTLLCMWLKQLPSIFAWTWVYLWSHLENCRFFKSDSNFFYPKQLIVFIPVQYSDMCDLWCEI